MICLEVFFPFVFSPLLIRLPYTFQNQSRKKTQWAPGRCHAKAGITHHPSAHIREGSSSLSQLFPLTGTHSEAQNGTSSAISKDKLINDKPDCHFIGRRTHTAAALGAASGYGGSWARCRYPTADTQRAPQEHIKRVQLSPQLMVSIFDYIRLGEEITYYIRVSYLYSERLQVTWQRTQQILK